jgi:hypothetical protein
MRHVKIGVFIWTIGLVLTASFDMLMLYLTNQDFNFDYTIGFGVLVFVFLFIKAYPEIFQVPFKFKKRKDFVTELTNAVRVKRK